MDTILGYMLLGGVSLSMVLIVAGLYWHYMNTGQLWLDHQLSGMNLFQFVMLEIELVLRGQVRPRTLVDGGIALLLLTPYLRVVVSMVYFIAVLKNIKYFFFTAAVLAVLTYSLFLR